MPKRIVAPDARHYMQRWAAIGDVEDRPGTLHIFASAYIGHPIEACIAGGWPGWLPDVIEALFALSPQMGVRKYEEIKAALWPLSDMLATPVDYEAARWRLLISTLTSLPGYDPDGATHRIVRLLQRSAAGEDVPALRWGREREALRLHARSSDEHAFGTVAALTAEAVVLAATWPLQRDGATARVLRAERRTAVSAAQHRRAQPALEQLEREIAHRQRQRLIGALQGAAATEAA